MRTKKTNCSMAYEEFNKALGYKKFGVLIRNNEIVGKISYRDTGKNVYIAVLLNITGPFYRGGYFAKMHRYTTFSTALISAFEAFIPDLNLVGLNICRNGIESNLQGELKRLGFSLEYLA